MKNGAMAAKQASTKRVSLMLGYDCHETQLVLKAFYSRKEDEGLKSNVELLKLLLLTTQADTNSGLKVWGDLKATAKPGPKTKQETTPTSVLLPKIIVKRTDVTTNPPLAVVLVKAHGPTETFGDFQEGPLESQRYMHIHTYMSIFMFVILF